MPARICPWLKVFRRDDELILRAAGFDRARSVAHTLVKACFPSPRIVAECDKVPTIQMCGLARRHPFRSVPVMRDRRRQEPVAGVEECIAQLPRHPLRGQGVPAGRLQSGAKPQGEREGGGRVERLGVRDFDVGPKVVGLLANGNRSRLPPVDQLFFVSRPSGIRVSVNQPDDL